MKSNPNKQVWLNVASSTYVLPGFINLDNHIFIKIRWMLPVLKKFLSKDKAQFANEYLKASKKEILVQHDCRKKLRYPDKSVDHILCSHFLEHVYPEEMKVILEDFYRVLKQGGTLHVIVPDLHKIAEEYIASYNKGENDAADKFISNSILSKSNRGKLRYRMMELHGGFGLQHRWMYDQNSMRKYVSDAGFKVMDHLDVPSSDFRKNDDSVHILAVKGGR